MKDILINKRDFYLKVSQLTASAGVIRHLVHPLDGFILFFLFFLEKHLLKLCESHVVLELFLEFGKSDVVIILIGFNLGGDGEGFNTNFSVREQGRETLQSFYGGRTGCNDSGLAGSGASALDLKKHY